MEPPDGMMKSCPCSDANSRSDTGGVIDVAKRPASAQGWPALARNRRSDERRDRSLVRSTGHDAGGGSRWVRLNLGNRPPDSTRSGGRARDVGMLVADLRNRGNYQPGRD